MPTAEHASVGQIFEGRHGGKDKSKQNMHRVSDLVAVCPRTQPAKQISLLPPSDAHHQDLPGTNLARL